MSIKIYGYKNCGTCRKAWKWLEEKGLPFEKVQIRETPPSKEELKRMAKTYDGDLKRLFNTSGKDYREGGWKDRIGTLSEDEVFEALASNGNLIKRPFVLSEKRDVVGFKPEIWEQLL